MNYLRNKAALLLLVYIATAHIACQKSFLDVPVIPGASDVIKQDYIKDLTTTEQFLNGVYVDLSRYFFNSYFLIYPDLIADNVKPPIGSATFSLHYNWSQVADEIATDESSPSDNNMNGFWTSGYKIVRSCNFVIENVDRFRMENPNKADNLKGQAYAVRAMIHHYLVNVFSQPYKFTSDGSHPGIAYVTGSDWTQPITRISVADVYENIVSDLNISLQLLQANMGPENKLFMNRNAANAVLSRVFLFKGDYIAAKDIARDVISITPIMITDYPDKLYTEEDKESLFQLAPNNTTYYTLYPGIWYRYGEFNATEDIATILNERQNDLRRLWVTQDPSTSTWMVTKFPMDVVPGFDLPEGSYYPAIVRSSEMYLTAAECYAQIGNTDSAWYYLDAIRQRADATAPASNTVGLALLDTIYKERRKELCFENLRMYDLLRTGKGVTRSDPNSPAIANLPYPSAKAIAPLPKRDVDYYKLQQNISY